MFKGPKVGAVSCLRNMALGSDGGCAIRTELVLPPAPWAQPSSNREQGLVNTCLVRIPHKDRKERDLHWLETVGGRVGDFSERRVVKSHDPPDGRLRHVNRARPPRAL